MVKIVKIPEMVVKDIQEAHVKADSLKSLIGSLVEKHSQDADDKFIESLVFQKLLKQYAESHADYESKKAFMPEYIPGIVGYVAGDWSLNYVTAELTVHYSDAQGCA